MSVEGPHRGDDERVSDETVDPETPSVPLEAPIEVPVDDLLDQHREVPLPDEPDE